MAATHPSLSFVLNGGIPDLDESLSHLETFDGVMLGRAAYERPFLLAGVDEKLFGEAPRGITRAEVIEAVAAKAAAMEVPIWRFARHMLGLFHGEAGAREWRRRISEEGRGRTASPGWLVALGREISEKADAAA